jgi:predicted short-subunit dehydrogenase-like oxidoreductase (DUF2520 family)
MQKSVKHKIVILGCGNVAWHLAKHFFSLKNYELFIYNHKPNALLDDFRSKLKCSTASSLNKIIPNADFYFICVTDKYISEVVKKIKIENKNSVLIHTSGSAKIEELGEDNNSAVFYPLQSFSKNTNVNWKEIPIIIEAKKLSVKKKILDLAKLFSYNVVSLSYKERLKLHLAAVIVNNFVNALFVSAGDLISKNTHKNKLKILLPLIKQTVLKIESVDPRAAQTGPAKRNDDTVMKKHLKLLSEEKDLKNIYKQLSKLIVKQQTKSHA